MTGRGEAVGRQLAERCRQELPLAAAELSEGYWYAHLPLCVIDAVYSIGVDYRSTAATVMRVCTRIGITRIDRLRPAPRGQQWAIDDLLREFDHHGAERLAEQLFSNRQRTSSVNGVLKAAAVEQFCRVCAAHGVQVFQDLDAVRDDAAFSAAIRRIPGQRSGIALGYFWMLAGIDDMIKPDRHLVRFVRPLLGRDPTTDECRQLFSEAVEALRGEYPHMTARLLDHTVWQYMRSRQNNSE
jgi:hypothetical protein